jgi:hypothetical protein
VDDETPHRSLRGGGADVTGAKVPSGADILLAAMTVLNGINDKGQVVGFYLDAAGNTDGMLVNVSVHHS